MSLRLDVTRRKLLVVPHICADDIRVREIEFAERLAGSFETYCLRWADPLHVNASSVRRRRVEQLNRIVRTMLSPPRLGPPQPATGIRYVQLPLVQSVLLGRLFGPERARALARRLNAWVLGRAIRYLGIDHVLLASGEFDVPRHTGASVTFDLVDWFEEDGARPWELRDTRRFLERIRERADGVVTVSEPLSEKLRDEYGLESTAIANGADVTALRSVSSEEVAAVRRRWGLEGRYVIGYMGNHVPFSGVSFLLRVFEVVRRRMPDACLFIVGPAHDWIREQSVLARRGVVLTGPVPPREMPAYFNAIDVGVLAQQESPFTDLAFQIKVVEYTACRKLVVAPPFQVWRRLAWPNVELVAREVEPWADALVRLRSAAWSPSWDVVVADFDWNRLSARLGQVLLGAGTSGGRIAARSAESGIPFSALTTRSAARPSP